MCIDSLILAEVACPWCGSFVDLWYLHDDERQLLATCGSCGRAWVMEGWPRNDTT